MTGHSTQRLTIFPGGVLFWPIIPAIDTHKEECRDEYILRIMPLSFIFVNDVPEIKPTADYYGICWKDAP